MYVVCQKFGMRDESLYNLAQENEIFIVLKYLPDAAMHVANDDSLWTGTGRPPNDLYDILVSLTLWHYIGWSARRSIGMIKLLCKFARMQVCVPSWRTLSRYREKEIIKKYTNRLIGMTSRPLRFLEHDFSTDMTGVSTNCFSTWFSLRCGKRIRYRDHIATHVTTSRMLNSCVAIDVDCNKGKDSEYMREHILRVSKNFLINDWSGDSKYLARQNCEAVENVGGVPWFKLKSNTTPKPRGCLAWKRMVKLGLIDSEEFDRHYHKRSNSESTFSSKKRKFGSFVRSRHNTSKENEEHLKWVGYNLGVLSRAHYEHKLNIVF